MTGTVQARRNIRWVRAAWVSVALVPVGVVLSFFVGEGLLTAQGYESSDSAIPVGVVLLAALPAVLVMLLPCLAAFGFGWRVRHEDPRGRVPAVVGLALGVAFLAINLVGLLGRALGG